MKNSVLVFAFLFLLSAGTTAQDIEQLLDKAKKRLSLVNDYQADGRMKTNVAFLKIPVANVKVYFKKPNRLKVKNERGISFIPKGAVSINMQNLLTDQQYTIIDGGKEMAGKVVLRIAKLLPVDENSDVILSTIYIEEATGLIRKARTTTRDNGTYELEMNYGKYAAFGLPDKIVFSFNTKDYKLPKGMTFDFDDGSNSKPVAASDKNKKGRAEIVFFSYSINKGLPESVFN
jgi:hypothetical protein